MLERRHEVRKQKTTPPTSSMLFCRIEESELEIGASMRLTSPPMRCVRSPTRIPSKKAMSCRMIALTDAARTCHERRRSLGECTRRDEMLVKDAPGWSRVER